MREIEGGDIVISKPFTYDGFYVQYVSGVWQFFGKDGYYRRSFRSFRSLLLYLRDEWPNDRMEEELEK